MLSKCCHVPSDSAYDVWGSADGGCDEKQGRPAVSELKVQIEGRTEDGRGPPYVCWTAGLLDPCITADPVEWALCGYWSGTFPLTVTSRISFSVSIQPDSTYIL